MLNKFLSDRAKKISFPKSGIMSQSVQAKKSKINATAGIGLDDDGQPIRLSSIDKLIDVKPKDAFLYAPVFGRSDLRHKWRDLIYTKNPDLQDKISLPIVTSGITHALNAACFLFINRGDEVLVADKQWGNYKHLVENLYEAEINTFNTFKDGGIDVEDLQQELEKRKERVVLLLNFPNNPSGYTPTEEEMDRMAFILQKQAEKGKKIVVILDDAYFGLTYDKTSYKQSFIVKMQRAHENILVAKLDGATKEDYVWGFRVGFISFYHSSQSRKLYSSLLDKTAAFIRANISSASNLSQFLIYKAYTDPTYWDEKQIKYDLLKSRYLEVKRILKNIDHKEYFDPLPFNSGYFMCIRLKNYDAEKLRQQLLEKYSVGVIAIGTDIIRIAYSSVAKKDISTIFANIMNILNA